ncbi:MAG: hypothetical protein Q8M02_10540 [Candidatus Didemnitutus sp.]|nr:hypothetical protein [Candidatus Didemnitutus sp.]
MSEMTKQPPGPADEQAAAANRVARQMAGSAIEPTAAPAAPKPDADDLSDDVKPHVRLPCEGYGLHRFAREIGGLCKMNGVFRMQDVPVLINYEIGQAVPLSPGRFRTYAHRLCVPAKFKWDKEGNRDEVEMTMSKDVAADTLQSLEFIEQQRALAKVNAERMPLVRPSDGRLVLLKPGYDEESKIYTLPTALEIDEAMTVDAARAFINDLVGEVPWGDVKPDTEEHRAAGVVGLSRSKAVWLSCAVSLYGSGLLHPLSNRIHYVFVANAQRSGKTLVAKMAVVPIFGLSKSKSKPHDDNELRKMLTAAARGNAPYFLLDDLEGMLRSTDLNAFMTAPTWSDRKFNTQEEMSSPKQTVVVITGNNLGLSTDIANRTLRCQLYTEEFDAQSRVINRVIDEEYLARPSVRRQFLSAMWCFVREWDKAGRPKGKRVLKGFEAWCDIFGGIVSHAGFGDPVEAPPTDDFSGDTEGADMQTLVGVLVEDMGVLTKKEYQFAELVDAAREHDCFTWMIKGRERTEKESDKTTYDLEPTAKSSMGKMFSAKYGGRKFRLADGRVVQFGQRGRNRHRRYVVEVLT